MPSFRGFLFLLLIQVTRGSLGKNTFKDQRSNFVTANTYQETLRRFRGENFGPILVDDNARRYYVGGKNIFYIFDMNDDLDDSFSVRNFTWPVMDNATARCTVRGTPFWECQNYVRVLARNDVEDKLLVCGTYALIPKCVYFEDETLTIYHEKNGIMICPFLPTQKSTAVYADGQLFTGTVSDNSARDSVFSKTDHGHFRIRSEFLNSMWMKIPEFIASFDIDDDWIVFFFREIAIESGNAREAVYSRVAKVCKNDFGGGWLLENTWTTFQKATINCSLPGAFPFYFNYLQDVFVLVDGKNVTFFGVFTTGDHEIPGSAVCSFHLTSIRDIFERGQFKGNDRGNWYTVPHDDVPVPRPGACVEDSRSQPLRTLSFIKDHPFMKSSVPNDEDPHPLFHMTRTDFRLVQIAVRTVRNMSVLYLGTDDGRILKVAVFKDDRGKVRSNFLEEIFIGPRDKPESILNIEIIVNDVNEKVLLVITNTTVVEVPFERCRHLSACACRQDPYCSSGNLTTATCSKLTEPDRFPSHYPQNSQNCGRHPTDSNFATNTSPDYVNYSCQSPSIPTALYVSLAFGWIGWLLLAITLLIILLYRNIFRTGAARVQKQNVELSEDVYS
jgi:semaphorin 6